MTHAPEVEVADRFTIEQLWMLYGAAWGEVESRERAERETFRNHDAAEWLGVRAKIRYLIELHHVGRSATAASASGADPDLFSERAGNV